MLKSTSAMFAIVATTVIVLVSSLVVTVVSGAPEQGEFVASVDDVKCQVCDVAASFYARAVLSAHLYCLDITDDSPTMKYVVEYLKPFAVAELSRDFCVPGAGADKIGTTQEAPEQEMKSEEAEAEEKSNGGDDDDAATGATPKKKLVGYFAVDDHALVEFGRKAWLCRKFLPAFPAVEVFAENDKTPMTNEDLLTWKEKPEPVHPRFVDLLVRACDVTTGNTKRTAMLIDHTRRLVSEFPVLDGPRTKDGAMNHVYKKLLKPIQEAICSIACDSTMQRPDNYKPLVAYNVNSDPVLQ